MRRFPVSCLSLLDGQVTSTSTFPDCAVVPLGKCYGDVECAATLARHYARGRNLQTVIASIGTTFLRGARAHHEQAELVGGGFCVLRRFLCYAVGAARTHLFGNLRAEKIQHLLPSPALAPATWLGIWNCLACVAPTAATSRPDRMPCLLARKDCRGAHAIITNPPHRAR